MNGHPPPYDSPEMVALVSYSYWLAQRAPTGADMPGRGYPKVATPPQAADKTRGMAVYEQNCAICHGMNGQGTKVDGRYAFPPLWGKDSYNAGAGMFRVETAAAFIKANMPLGKGGSLSDQQAWDVAQFVNSHERPADPRER
jgi:thiosulfate dehydrogenase